ncbi:MG2 domain-containing protein [Allorhizobium ampelinum]|uniref:MG2 domain-containing protein n=1 Tax=Allorhizobium ampelinum TaxID=3025782 RepID=UPI003AB96709
MGLQRIFAGTVLAFLGLMLPASIQSAMAAETNRSIALTQDGDYSGFDLRTAQNVTLDQCQASCIDDKSCRAFTYNIKARWCFLKSDFNQISPFAGAVAGKIVTSATEPDIGAPAKLGFISDGLRAQANAFKARLAQTAEQPELGLNGLIGRAHASLSAGKGTDALAGFLAAVQLSPEDASLWISAARAANTIKDDRATANQGLYAALLGYDLTRSAKERADALAVLAKALEKNENFRGALNAYKASLELVADKSVRAAYLALKATKGFRITGNSVDADAASPRACVQFSDPLINRGTDYTAFVTVNGKPPKVLEAKDSQLCVEGLDYGQRYTIGLREGLPSSVDEPLAAKTDIDVYIRDRSPTVRFTGDHFVLPSAARRGIPLVSVNTERANLKLYRIGERAIAPLMSNSQFLSQLSGYGADRIEKDNGELVWQGAIDIESSLNREVTTSFPVDEALPERKPGIYVLTAAAAAGKSDEWEDRATQWFLVSDIGLSTFAGTDGLNVFARSLNSAKPIAGVELKLLARNNEILGTATTDEQGRATFSAGLMRSGAALAPAVLTGEQPGKDFVFLDMTKAGFDLSDRGVTGRTAPGAIDIFAWTERGIYRPGDMVHVAALARDIGAEAIDGLPLTFIFTRPDGVEYRRMVSTGAGLGGHVVDLALDTSVMRGTWTLGIHVDPKKPAIAEKTFLVDDFLPDRIEFDLKPAAEMLKPGMPLSVGVDGRYLYGAPAAGLSLEGDMVIKPTRSRDDLPGFVFGLADEEAGDNSSLTLDALQPLDDKGHGSVDLQVDDLPATTQLLQAQLSVRLKEGGGRAVERQLTLPVETGQPAIGIKPEFSGELSENSTGHFQLIALDADGKPQALPGAKWKLLKLERDYQWYRDGSAWRFEPITTTKLAASGTVDIGAEKTDLPMPVGWGRYRLEVDAPTPNGAASSIEFNAGWFVEAGSTETPDALEIGLDKPVYKIGETAKLKVSSRYAGEVLVTIGSETLIATQTASLAATGGEIDIPVTDNIGAGTYITATLYRPGESQETRMPMRAIGVTWLSVDPANRKLAIKLTPPQQIEPRRKLTVPISVTGGGNDAYVTVAAVDVGILNLTRFETPDPDGWYFGQRRLGIEMRDLYGQLIDGSLGAMGKLRTGGDGGMMALQASPPKEKLVALFSGPVHLDHTGKAQVEFDIPQFNGTVRLMAVAWNRTGIGHAQTDVIVRDPVVITASLPRFLAPGDQARLQLDLAATDAPDGDYLLSLKGNPSVEIDPAKAQIPVTLKAGARTSLSVGLKGLAPGDGTVSVALTSAGGASTGEANGAGTSATGANTGETKNTGLSLTRSLDLPVRPAALPVTTRRELPLAAGKSLSVDSDLLADSVLQGASLSLSVSRGANFDIAALLTSLDRYPYGCAEQTTSRALPLLYLNDLANVAGLPADADINRRIQDAIYRVLSYQAAQGSFGLWAPGSEDLWLDAYVSDFLTRAREKGFDVPDNALVQALDNLANKLSYDTDVEAQGNEIAYALYVLARNRRAAISDLRYYADTILDRFPTPLSKAHLAAALSLYGDPVKAEAIFRTASEQSQQGSITPVSLARSDYGSQLRDGAAILALAAEARPVPPIIPALSRSVIEDWKRKSYTSTQEESWMLLAARALDKSDDGLSVTVNGSLKTGGYRARIEGEELMHQPVTLDNTSADPLTATVTTVAVPKYPLPAASEGFTIERSYYTLSGEKVNISEAAQNQRYVVVLKVAQTAMGEPSLPTQLLVTDLLPAGLEIDNPALVGSADLANFDWLGETKAAHLEFRDDRFVAALDSASQDSGDMVLAYVVRAVTPGVFDLPAASVEDMYRPQRYARTAMGRMEVKAEQ